MTCGVEPQKLDSRRELADRIQQRLDECRYPPVESPHPQVRLDEYGRCEIPRCYHHSLKPSTTVSSPIKEEDALSVVVNLEQVNGVLQGTTTIRRENSEVYFVSAATISFWVVDGKTQIYIALPRLTSHAPQLPSGESSTKKSETIPNSTPEESLRDYMDPMSHEGL